MLTFVMVALVAVGLFYHLPRHTDRVEARQDARLMWVLNRFDRVQDRDEREKGELIRQNGDLVRQLSAGVAEPDPSLVKRP